MDRKRTSLYDKIPLYSAPIVVLVVQWFGVGLVIERSRIRLPAGRYQINFHPSEVGKSSTSLHGWG